MSDLRPTWVCENCGQRPLGEWAITNHRCPEPMSDLRPTWNVRETVDPEHGARAALYYGNQLVRYCRNRAEAIARAERANTEERVMSDLRPTDAAALDAIAVLLSGLAKNEPDPLEVLHYIAEWVQATGRAVPSSDENASV